MGSDHFPILVTIESCINYENFDSGEKIIFGKADWKTFPKPRSNINIRKYT